MHGRKTLIGVDRLVFAVRTEIKPAYSPQHRPSWAQERSPSTSQSLLVPSFKLPNDHTTSRATMSQPDQADPEPTSAPYSLEAAEQPGEGHPHSHNPNQNHNNQEDRTEGEAELDDQFQSVSLDQHEPHLNIVKSPKLQHSFDPAVSDTSSHSPSSEVRPTASATASTDNSLATTTQPSSTHSVNQDGPEPTLESEASAKADAQPEPAAPPATTPPAPTPQPKPSTSAPTTMQKVVSLTRQRDLPPKSKEEEVSD
jgi:hypothetical protein